MCVSAPVSFAASAALVPLGVYTISKARQVDPYYLPLAVFPLAFGIQQALEAIVWLNVGTNNINFLYLAGFAFLFFSHFFWPAWVPFSAYSIEKNGWRRKILAGITIVGTLFGASLYVPMIINKALEIGIAGGSIQYDTGLIYDPWISTGVVRWFYVAVVVSPCLIVKHSGFRIFGVLLAASLLVSYLFYDYAFISVWCFFAAIISLFIVYLVHKRMKEVERAG